jgi:cell division topological specificity factor
MSLLDLFRSRRESSASTAKERLQIIVSHERTRKLRGNTINLQELKQKLVSVISQYLHIDEQEFSVQLQHDADHSVLEMNVTLPDKVDA